MRGMLVEAILLAIQVVIAVRLLKPVLVRQIQEIVLSLLFFSSLWRR